MRKNFRTNRNRKVEKKNLNKFKKIKWKCIDHEKTTQKQKSVSGTLDVSGSPFHQDPSRNTWTLLAFWRPGPTAFTRSESESESEFTLSTTDFRTHFCFFSQQVEVHWSWKNNTKTEKCFWNAWCFRVPFSSRSLKEYMDPCWRFEGQNPQPSLDQQLTFALISVSFHNKWKCIDHEKTTQKQRSVSGTLDVSGPLFIKIPQGIHGPCWRFEGQDPQPSLDQQLTFALISVSFHNKWKCIDHEKTTQKQKSVSGTLDVSGSPFHQDPSRNTWTLLAFWRPEPTAFTRSTTDFRTHFCFFSQQVEVHWSWKKQHKNREVFLERLMFQVPFSSRSLKEYMDPAGVLKARTHSLHSINNWLSHSFLFLFTTSGSALIMKKQHKNRKVFLERLMFQGPLFIKIPQGIHGPCWRFEGQDPQPSLDQQLTFALISVSFHNKFFFFQFKILHASATVLISKNAFTRSTTDFRTHFCFFSQQVEVHWSWKNNTKTEKCFWNAWCFRVPFSSRSLKEYMDPAGVLKARTHSLHSINNWLSHSFLFLFTTSFFFFPIQDFTCKHNGTHIKKWYGPISPNVTLWSHENKIEEKHTEKNEDKIQSWRSENEYKLYI